MRGLSSFARTWSVPAFCLLLGAPQALAQSYSCATQVTDQVGIRARAVAELVAPVVIRCSGTKPAGGIVGAIHVALNVPFASRTLDPAINATEALLLIDNPPPGAQVGRAVDLVVPNANVVQGFYTSGVIVWQTLEIAPAGPAGPFVREFRLVNVRANVSQLAAPANVTMTVTLLTNPFVPFTGSQVNVGVVTGSGGVGARAPDDSSDYTRVIDGCVGNNPIVFADSFRDLNVRFGEGNANEFRKRNVATSANASSAIANQNDPLVSYGTETGFFNNSFTPVNSMNQAGLATNGTRLMARFTGIPSGVSVYVTTNPVPEGTISSNIVARLTNTDANGAGQYSPVTASIGAFAQVPVVNGVATAVWEVLESNPDSLELVSFGVILSVPVNTPTFGKISLTGGLAPLVAQGGAFAAPVFSGLPLAREIAEIRTCATLLTVASSCPLNAASIGQPYNLLVAASGGTPPYGWTLAGGSLPQGIQLNTNGLISGSPQVTGDFVFVFKVTDFLGATTTKEC
ncbi:MAG: Ig domain-containing protein, partial [Acidobacteriota bacterium]